MSEEDQQSDICRVCRCEGTPERPLFHPCICTGSIKFIHQECLVQWLRYSKKEFCELCNHQFSFIPIYSPDMPKRLPIRVIVSGLVSNLARAVRFWMHYTLVAVAWLGVVPLSACRIYRCLFTGSVSSVLTLPLDMISAENLTSDILHGCVVVLCTLCAFIGLVWLREQILHGGGPDWLEPAPAEEENGNARPPAGGGNVADAQPAGPPDPGNPPNPEQNVAEENVDGGQPRNGVNEEAGWNPMDWERAAEELTWERLLGLDGSLVFLEHVFWVASLNTLFILVFAFSPYHIGHFAIVGFKLKDQIAASHFEGFVTTLCGYVIIGLAFVVLHAVAAVLQLRRVKRIVGLCYVVVKVSLLIVAEIGVFPIICGWWLDVCSLSLVDATLKDRITTFRKAPGTSMFLHWLGGIMAVFYFASFVLLLREVVRPGLLWFLRNLNDPDFSPIQEMIHLPILRHLKRFVMSMVIFGSLVLVIVKVPVSVIRTVLPEFLPFNFSHSIDLQVPEFSLELLVLQVILPCLLEQVHTRQWLLGVLRGWCSVVGSVLGIKSYLLGDGTPRTQPAQAPAPGALPAAGEDAAGIFRLGAAHQAFLQRDSPVGHQSYEKPNWFPVRVILMLVMMCASLTIFSLLALVIPVSIGRGVMSFVYPDGQLHELYTAFTGLYICWLSLRFGSLLYAWIPEGWGAMVERLKMWAKIGVKSLIAVSLLVGVIPFLLGLVLDLVLIVPLRVPLHQTPVYFLAQDWCLGVLYTKIVCAVTMMSPDWWLRHALEQMYQNGLRNLDLNFVIFELAGPGIFWLGVALSGPYVIGHSIAPYFVTNMDLLGLVQRRIYPFCFFVVALGGVIYWQTAQFKRLYEHIRNDRYLVGRRLVNYHRPANKTQPSALVVADARN